MAVTASSLREELEAIGRQARAASDALRPMSTAIKDAALRDVAKRLRAAPSELQAENRKDLEAGREQGL
ncbi:MAG: gamma-glutamyl-phosphate reductase, partial [Candidatus Hydrogenedentes bacterium]|nr:gamma-glutamyl-phosphate reductase [Candidatus Hydrogenedentota bacterium]